MVQEVGVIDLDSVENEVVRAGISYWRRIKGGRVYPSRRQVAPRELGALLRNFVLVEVIDGGSEYEFRIVGSAHAQTVGFNMQGGQIRDVRRVWPDWADSLLKVYGRVVATRQPIALRAVREDVPAMGTIASENVLLPLGKNENSVDHIMVFSVYRSLNLPQERAAC